MELLVTNNKQLENELQVEQQNHRSALERLEQFEANQQSKIVDIFLALCIEII